MTIERKEYLGDGLYVRFDGYGIVLTAENGISIQNEVALEPDVWQALLAYIGRLDASAKVMTGGKRGWPV